MSTWQETETSSGATIETEVNKDGTVTEEEEVETIPSSGYSVTGGDLPVIEIGGEGDDGGGGGGGRHDEDEDDEDDDDNRHRGDGNQKTAQTKSFHRYSRPRNHYLQ